MSIEMAREARLWITRVIIPATIIGMLVYNKNKEKIDAWVEKQKLRHYQT